MSYEFDRIKFGISGPTSSFKTTDVGGVLLQGKSVTIKDQRTRLLDHIKFFSDVRKELGRLQFDIYGLNKYIKENHDRVEFRAGNFKNLRSNANLNSDTSSYYLGARSGGSYTGKMLKKDIKKAENLVGEVCEAFNIPFNYSEETTEK